MKRHAKRATIRTAGDGAAITLLGLLAAFVSTPTWADPPYGDDFDAPETFAAAVGIAPTGWEAVYRGLFHERDDVDFYRFFVPQGSNIDVKCWMNAAAQASYYQPTPCASLLLDPDQVPQETNPSTWSYPCGCAWTSHHALNARAGEWRLRVTGSERPDGIPTTYYFQIVVSGIAPPAGDDGGGGSPAPVLLSVLWAVALWRASRWMRAGLASRL